MSTVVSQDLDVKHQIVRDAIRSAICIDDAYLAPYQEPEDDVNGEEPKKLYYSFRKTGHCDLDVYRFQGIDEWRKHRYLLHNKDLMVLDWELNPSSAQKYGPTLEIIDYIVNTQCIPFVVIYTNTPDLSEVSKNLLVNFNKYDGEDYNQILSGLNQKFENISNNSDEIESFIEDKEGFFYEYVKTYTKRAQLTEEFIADFSKFIELKEGIKPEKTLKKIISLFNELYGSESLEESILVLSNIFFSREIKNRSSEFDNDRTFIDKDCYSINGVVVLIIHKEDQENGVSTEDLFMAFSEAITENPHGIINLIALEIKDKFREDFSIIGTKFSAVDENAFLYHARNYYNKESSPEFNIEAFRHFVVMSWIHELMQHNLNQNLNSFDLIEDLLKENDIEKNDHLFKSLARYAALVSCVNISERSNNKLGFGDLFLSDQEYYLCITPHCDCFIPSKINNEFYFIKGVKASLRKALVNAEQGFYSFILEDDEPIVIDWECKPFTSFINDEMNSSKVKTISFSGELKELEFICSLKENYAQRISNNSFGYGHRVGIDLPHLNESD